MTAQATKRYVLVLLALAVLAVVVVTGFAAHSSSTAASVGPSNGTSSDSPNVAGAPASAANLARAAANSANRAESATYRGLVPVAHFDVSPPLRSMKPLQSKPGQMRENEDLERVGGTSSSNAPRQDTAVQKLIGPVAIPSPIVSFDGYSNLCGCAPPDPNGEVGANHVVAMGNLHFQIFNKSGTSLFGPAANNTLWSGFGGSCQTENAGDPVVLYDQLADRWLLTQFTGAGPTYYNCLALSTGPDPLGTYYRWAFTTGSNFPDYPKYGMWPNAYYISTREFAGASFAGVGAYAGNRAQMLAGNPNPQVISFLALPNPAYNVGDGLLPADLDGTALPPANSDQYYMGSMDNNGQYGAPQDALTLWKFHADFTNPPSSSFTLVNTLTSASFNTAYPCSGRACIPQPGTTNRIDILSYRQRPLFRLAYRNMGSFETLVTNQSVDAGAGPGGEIAGIRWWEVRSPNSSPIIFQEGTYAPGLTDGINRWMGSIAMDHVGDIALGYSVSSSTVFPGVRYTGRLPTDPPGQMPQGEGTIIEGTGSQTSAQRWGDYTDMTVDPVDDCTFWHVNEWVPTTSGSGWRLRIGAFRFPNCTTDPTPTPCVTCATNTPTRTPTVTMTRTITLTPTPSPCVPGYAFATSTGTIVPGTTDTGLHTDDGVTNIALPFPFALYGTSYNSANVSTNGNLQFVTTNIAFTNTCPPDTTMGPAIFPFWEDLRTDTTGTCTGGCGIYTSVSGTAPNRIFNIEWRAFYFTGPGNAYFEIRLYEQGGAFDVVTGTIDQNTGGTTGVQNGAAAFTQYQCNTTIGNNLRIAFTVQQCGTPTPPTNTPTLVPTSPPTVTSTPISTSTATSAVTNTRTPTPVPPTNSPTPCALSFSDVNPPDYFYVSVMYLACHGVISGYADGTFRPYNNTTRGQVCKIIVLAEGLTLECPTQHFSDVPPDHTFFCYIETAFLHNIVGGYADGTFRPGNDVTRGQLCKMIVVAEGWADDCPPPGHFSDVPVGSAFYCYIETAYNHGIISGYDDGTFRPGNSATRGQICKIVYNAITGP